MKSTPRCLHTDAVDQETFFRISIRACIIYTPKAAVTKNRMYIVRRVNANRLVDQNQLTPSLTISVPDIIMRARGYTVDDHNTYTCHVNVYEWHVCTQYRT